MLRIRMPSKCGDTFSAISASSLRATTLTFICCDLARNYKFLKETGR